MKIIQVLDLDGSTIKVDETNPSEPKIVSSLQCSELTNVAIGNVAELLFAKTVNANVEAVCVGYKGTDGKTYGMFNGTGEMLFPAKATSEPESSRTPFIELDIPANGGAMTLKVLVDAKGDTNLIGGYSLTNPYYVIIDNGTEAFRFDFVSEENGVYTLQADKGYTKELNGTMYVTLGKQAEYGNLGGTLTRVATYDDIDSQGGKYKLTSAHTTINQVMELLDHL